MRRSETLLFTSRESDGHENETVALTQRAGLVRQFGSGLYGTTPTGERVRERVVAALDDAMRSVGAQKVSLPQLNDSTIWQESGRWGSFEGEMFTFENRDGKQMCLAPSQEEGVVHLVDGVVRSYDDLPAVYYQIGSKHRDDHARNGLLRMKEFTMKDAYSLHVTAQSLDESYQAMRDAYARLFDSLGLEFVVTTAANSVMGGSDSEEFVAPVETGTLELVYCEADCRFGATEESPRQYEAGESCPECGADLVAGEGIEIGHVFKLGTRYSEAMGLTVDLADGTETEVLMGSYGIGVERLIHTILAQHSDDAGCRWVGDRTVAPYRAAIVPLDYSGEIQAVADRLHGEIGHGETLLVDDGEQTIGERFAESDLLGIPWKIVLGNHYEETGEVELESRDGETQYVDAERVAEVVNGDR